jgi:hypothetical protein
MKRIFLLSLAVVVVIFSAVSCKKSKPHPLHPTPANNKILSYTKFSSSTLNNTIVNENFQFSYDGSGRLIKIQYSTNDSTKVATDVATLIINFTYSPAGDTIYKTWVKTDGVNVVERDTFLVNASQGLLTDAFTPGNIYHYGYFGKLISSYGYSVYDSGTQLSSGTSFTSDNGDLYNEIYEGAINASFPDSGLQDDGFGVLNPALLVPPLLVYWTDLVTGAITIHGANSFTDVFSGYTSGHPMAIQIKTELNGPVDSPVVAYDTCIFPGGNFYTQKSYHIYPDLDNRPGDYLQIESFTKYGMNVYQNAHLIRQIVALNGPKTDVTYTIDADSKITQTYVVRTDEYNDQYTYVYKFQYATY